MRATFLHTTTLSRLRLRSQPVRLGIGILAAIVLVVTFTRLVSLRSVLLRLEHLNIPLALLAGGVFLGAYTVRALRWRRLLTPRPVTRTRAILIYQVAIFVNWLLPIRGGELVKSLLLRRLDDIPVSESLPTVAMDKLMDLLPAIILLVLLPFLPVHLSRPLWMLLLLVVVILLCSLAFVAVAARRRDVAMRFLDRLFALFPTALRRRVEPFAMRFVDALLGLVARPRLLAIAAMYTMAAVALDALFALLAFWAVGAFVNYPEILFGYTLYNLAYILPTPPGQIGSNEVIGLLVFSGLFYISRNAVGAMFLFSHPWTALLMTISGLVSLSVMGLNLRAAMSMSDQRAVEREAPVVPPSTLPDVEGANP